MPDTKIQALDNGPLLVNGEVEVLDGEGKLVSKHEKCFLCRCGKTTKAPYCSGAHKGQFENEVRA
jgi:CDGSH iron-sulfur domain-containing protein 3